MSKKEEVNCLDLHHFRPSSGQFLEAELFQKLDEFIRIKYLAACGGVRNTVSGPGPSLGFDTNRGRRGVGIHWDQFYKLARLTVTQLFAKFQIHALLPAALLPPNTS